MNGDGSSTTTISYYSLLVIRGARAGYRIDVPPAGLMLGREADGQGNLREDSTVSRQHARITLDARGRPLIEDLKSVNGTFVNNTKITRPQILQPGDTVHLGATALEVRRGTVDSHTSPPASVAAGVPEQLRRQAYELLRERRAAQSEAAFRALVASGDHASEGWYGAGLVRLHLLSDVDQADRYFERALRVDPRYSNAMYGRGLVAERRGSAADARHHFEQALTVDPDHQGAAEKLGAQVTAAAAAPQDRLPTSPSVVDTERALARAGRYGMYDLLKQDPSPLSRQTVALMDSLTIDLRPPFVAYVGRFLGGFLRFTLVVLLSVVTYGVFPLLALLVGYIRVKSTRIVLAKGRLQIEKGVFAKNLTNIDLWRVRNIDRRRPLLNRMTGDATLVFLLNPEPIADKTSRRHHRHSEHFHEQIIEVTGLARGARLDSVFQDLLNLTFLLKSNGLVKGIIQ